jgi:isoquinoline 1-oxidoreductase alpha subunit
MELDVNGQVRTFDAQPEMPLLWVLRDLLHMTGTKFGCGMALCGACTVHVDGQPVRSCITQVSTLAGKKVTTIEAMAEDSVGKRVQAAWLELGVPQCGYCQAGQIMSATSLIRQNPRPQDADIDKAMSGNICRCGTYPRIRAAIKRAADNAGSAG